MNITGKLRHKFHIRSQLQKRDEHEPPGIMTFYQFVI